ncbi:MAG: DUF423 domain-containing protein [Henriciella sp.]|nr:DUF423 domain-containing protein [Henriciella sp.]
MLVPIAAIAGFTAVALGAFGAHGLADRLTPEAVAWWDTATLYLLAHSAVALAVGLSGRAGLISTGGLIMIAGAVLFAATLYAMALGAPRWFGAITPIGGVAMLAGWALIGWSALSSNS